MKLTRFYCENIQAGNAQLDSIESHHLLHVMRLAAGTKVELFDGNGTLAEATVTETSRRSVRLAVESVETVNPRQAHRVIIAAAIARGQRFDWMISKCTELGVDCIVPLIFDRSVKQAAGNSAGIRYKKLLISAAKQSGRLFLPKITNPLDLKGGLDYINKEYPKAKKVFGGFGQDATEVISLSSDIFDVAAFIGPEGGMTVDEEEKLAVLGAVKVRLTDTILRIETASVAFASILCAFRDGLDDRAIR